MNPLWKWLPVALAQREGSMVVDWRYAGDTRLMEPFFADTVARLPRGEKFCRTTPVTALHEFAARDCLEPAAFVFHSSRSGSTLLAQLLATASQCVVISEASVIDDTLQFTEKPSTNEVATIFGSLLRALGQRRRADERHLIVKLDSWHITQLPFIRNAFPGVPLFYLYRNPAEILASHQRQRGLHMVPGMIARERLGLDAEPACLADLDGYCLRVLAGFFRAAQQPAAAGTLNLINYTQLPDLAWAGIAKRLSMSLDAQSVQAMRDRAARHAKRPDEIFCEDGVAKMPPDLAPALNKLFDDYRELERLRLAAEIW